MVAENHLFSAFLTGLGAPGLLMALATGNRLGDPPDVVRNSNLNIIGFAFAQETASEAEDLEAIINFDLLNLNNIVQCDGIKDLPSHMPVPGEIVIKDENSGAVTKLNRFDIGVEYLSEEINLPFEKLKR